MVLKPLSERIKKVRDKFEQAKARAWGMTVPELRQHLMKRKAEKRKYKMELRRKEQEEKQKFEKWKIEQKYKRKRIQAKKGRGSTGLTGMLEMLGGPPQKADYDPLGLFGSPTKTKRRKRVKK